MGCSVGETCCEGDCGQVRRFLIPCIGTVCPSGLSAPGLDWNWAADCCWPRHRELLQARGKEHKLGLPALRAPCRAAGTASHKLLQTSAARTLRRMHSAEQITAKRGVEFAGSRRGVGRGRGCRSKCCCQQEVFTSPAGMLKEGGADGQLWGMPTWHCLVLCVLTKHKVVLVFCLCVVTKRTRGSAHPLPSCGVECGWLVGRELGGWSWLGVPCARGGGGECCPQGSVWQQCSASPGGCGVPSNLTELWFCDVTVLPGGCKALNFFPVPRRNGELGFGAVRAQQNACTGNKCVDIPTQRSALCLVPSWSLISPGLSPC